MDSDTDWRIRGHMNCTVKSQHIVEIADGITKEFTSLEGEFIVGDTLRFDYFYFNHMFSSPTLRLGLHDEKRGDKTIMWIDGKLDDPNASNGDDMFYRHPLYGDFVSFGRDRISIQVVALHATLAFKRYYKSDWQGMYTQRYLPGVNLGQDKLARDMAQIATLDCRHGDDRIDAILSKYAETLKTLETKE
jgi:hypothetical protein